MKHAIISEVFDHPEALLNRTVDLKREGYEEEDMYVLVKRADVADAVRRHSNLYVLVTDEPGTVASLVTSSERPIERWLKSMRLTSEQQDRFAKEVEQGRLFLYVDADRSEQQVNATSSKTEPAPKTEEQTLALHEERLTIEKQAVQAGEVVINRHVSETEQEIEVPVRREQIHVERTTGSEDVVEDYDFDQPGIRTIDEGDHLRIQVIEERAFIVKRPVVVEEIIVRKQVTEDVKTMTETLRKEEIEVTEVGQADVTVEDHTTRKDETQ
ncbi:DUF2382 domain-containing protein [Exiguobacterium sp. s5]|uniref:YsnF/AvaK domain-containing protein n=1 Tax=Exiguobacterium sp. s5 TaxID=2751239 RepID=UPI001BE8FEAA|nr:DUF2382 domain-containing protein [Exiguobacterium sp. s5]